MNAAAITITTTLMPTLKSLMKESKQALMLWLEGCFEACCLHRVVILCLRSRMLLIRTGQCFLLNGLIFLGSIFILNSVVTPTLTWILPNQCLEISTQQFCPLEGVLKFYSMLRSGLLQLLYLCWFYPLYLFSFILSALWYNDIAKHGFAAMGRSSDNDVQNSNLNEVTTSENKTSVEKPGNIGGVVIGIGEQLYSMLLLSFFFLEVFATGFIPYIGKAINFILLSWMYAYYCFEYKWNFSEVALDRRLDFFESNWAFFAGFGSPCVLAIFFFSPLVSYGVMAILFPLFVLAATSSTSERLIFSQRRKWRSEGLGRLPIFYAADTLSMMVLSLIRLKPQEQIEEDKAL